MRWWLVWLAGLGRYGSVPINDAWRAGWDDAPCMFWRRVLREQSRPPLPRPRFEALAAVLLAMAESLVHQWLPGGVMRGHEYQCASVQGGAGTSFSVNLNSGKWADFASGEKGGDLIGLYMACFAVQSMTHAAVQIARELGLEDVAGVQPVRNGDVAPKREPRPAPPPAAPKVDREGWKTMMPVPAHAPAATFKHPHHKIEDIAHTATYQMGGQLLGYVVRFTTSDGGKETLPYTWCISERDGSCAWKWKTWDEPRPLYVPAGTMPSLRTVVLVEGEKKADALHELLEAAHPGIYLVASWVGGCNGWKKALWDWLAGCTVLLWPDCDAKLEKLTPAEKKGLDDAACIVLQQAKPLLVPAKQPGMAAMLGIGALLVAEHGCTVQLLPIPEPGAVDDGWDCGDAINSDGWDAARVLAFFGQAQALPANDAAVGDGAGGGNPPPPKNRERLAEADGKDDAFTEHLEFLCETLKCKVHELGVNRKLLIAALRKAPHLKDCLGLNELTGAPSTRVAWPWRAEPGPLKDNDDLQLGDWLCAKYKLKAASRAALAEAIETVADQRRFHPVCDWLKASVHDGKPRLGKWLIYVLGIDPAGISSQRRQYLELVGKFLLMGLVARVMDPGCKFDYSPVFEGLTGVGKSTLVRELVGKDFFSDTHFDIGNGKDGMEQLEGLWAYELSEMTAFRRADNEQVKQFFSSMVDRFRGAYGKFVQKHPRQCVIVCTTNKRQYLYDLTGNRRFWPVWIEQRIRIEWLKKWREQLFAEAYAAYSAGEAYAPTPEQEEEFFVPEQKLRLVETAVQSRLYELLTREGASSMEGATTNQLNQLTTFVTLDRLVTALGADAAKSSSLLETQIRGWLEAHDWTYRREPTGQRRRGYWQPKTWPPLIEDDPIEAQIISEDRQALATTDGGGDDVPF